MEKLEALVSDIVFQSADGAFCVLRAQNAGLGKFTAVYRGPAPFLGENVSMEGEWVEHSRFGRQFSASLLRVIAPTSVAGIERFLASGAISGVGPVLASRIVALFGAGTLEVMGSNPEKLAAVKGISKKKAVEIGCAYSELSELRELMLFLESNGVSGSYAARLHAKYGSLAVDVIKENPYSLATDIEGIGFKTADRIAMAMGTAPDSRERLSAGLAYTLTQASSAGHTCIPEEILLEEAARALNVDVSCVKECFDDLLSHDLLRTETVGGLRLIYPEYLYKAEVQTARRLIALRDMAKPLTGVDADGVIAAWEKEAGISLADAQRKAVYASLRHGVLILTGGPGTGKTTVVRGILNVLEKAGLRILLAAPTGRAARRLADSSGRQAKTVHRLLEAQPGRKGLYFGRNDANPLDAEAVVIDEASMMDLNLTYHLLKAIPGGSRLVFVGDVDQLPSVGAGSVLKDMIRSERLPVVRLENVFRQAEVSPIVLNAHKINKGLEPAFTQGFKSEFSLTPFSDEAAAAEFAAASYARLAREGGWRSVQVLSPMHRNACGVENLNKLLQKYVNPPRPGMAEIPVPNNVLRVGDKVMQTRNNYDKVVFNGDIGIVSEIDGRNVAVSFPDRPEGSRVVYEKGETDELALAYALSVHKSQGSEYANVILMMVPSHYVMLQRNLLYTAVTRAKERVMVVGSKKAVMTAVANDRTRRRYSLLAERLQQDGSIFS